MGILPGAWTLPHVLAWLLDSDYSYCIALDQRCLKQLGHWFLLNCRKYWKNSGPQWGVFNPHPSDCAVWKILIIRLVIMTYLLKVSHLKYFTLYWIFSHCNEEISHYIVIIASWYSYIQWWSVSKSFKDQFWLLDEVRKLTTWREEFQKLSSDVSLDKESKDSS